MRPETRAKIDDLKGLHDSIKLMTYGSDLSYLSEWLKSFRRSKHTTNQQLRMALLATKHVKNHPDIRIEIKNIVTDLEERTGRPII